MATKMVWEIRVKNESECVASVRVPEYTGIDICPVYEKCNESPPEPPTTKNLWHRMSNDPPLVSGRYLVCIKQTIQPVIAHAFVCQYTSGPIT